MEVDDLFDVFDESTDKKKYKYILTIQRPIKRQNVTDSSQLNKTPKLEREEWMYEGEGTKRIVFEEVIPDCFIN